MHCIVSGFGPFDKFAANPSEEAVTALSESLTCPGRAKAIPLTRLLLPTCCDRSWRALEDALLTHPAPLAVILSGLAHKRTRIGLERFALNIRDYRIADNTGHQWKDELIEKRGPAAVRTQLPLSGLLERLQGSGFACEISNHAGTFVCNEIYYRALRSLRASPQQCAVLFVHFPLTEKYGAPEDTDSDSGEPTAPAADRAQVISTYAAALQEIARFACLWVANGQATRTGARRPRS